MHNLQEKSGLARDHKIQTPILGTKVCWPTNPVNWGSILSFLSWNLSQKWKQGWKLHKFPGTLLRNHFLTATSFGLSCWQLLFFQCLFLFIFLMLFWNSWTSTYGTEIPSDTIQQNWKVIQSFPAFLPEFLEISDLR